MDEGNFPAAAEGRLWALAVQTAAEAGMEFTVPCSRNLRDLIRAGVSAMRRGGRTLEADGGEAEASLGRLVGEMIRATRALGAGAVSGSKTVLREGALVDAKKLTGLWPYV